jgi:hypothetical protein
MALDKLTIKQEKYAQNLFAGMSQREAYKQSYNCENMSDVAIDVEACNLAANPKVALRIEQLTLQLQERNMATVENVLSELSHIAFDDIRNYLEFYQEGEEVKVKIKDSKTIDTRNIKSVQISKKNGFKFEQYCKDTALQQLAKILGMMTDKLEIKNPEGESFRIESVADADKIIAELSSKFTVKPKD